MPSSQISSLEDHLRVFVNVGERQFITTKATLSQSHYFQKRFVEYPNDDPHHIDGDGNYFEHILRYLRTQVLPVFYTREKGHDHALYDAILKEARFYGIPRLIEWLHTKKYEEAAKLVITTVVSEPSLSEENPQTVDRFVSPWNADFEQTHHWTYQKKFSCPLSDNGSPCNINCVDRNTRTKVHREVETNSFNQLRIVQVKKEVVFDQKLCSEWQPGLNMV